MAMGFICRALVNSKWETSTQFLHSGIRKFSMRFNESWNAPMLVERMLTMERCNALNVLL